MRLIFAGTPQAAVPSLEILAASSHEVVAVLTRPPAPAGRGRAERRSAVHVRADELGIEVLTPSSLRDDGVLGRIRALRPDCCPVVAYGAMIPPHAVGIPTHGWVNLHFSLLPRWRGAAPVQHAIAAGDEVTGATTFVIDAGLDTGPVLSRFETPIGSSETSGQLLDRLAVTGADLLLRTMDGLAGGSLVAIPQAEEGVSLAPRIDTADARVDWTESADAVSRRIRAMTPAPGAWTLLRDARIKVGPVEVADSADLAPGELAMQGSRVSVGTGSFDVVLGDIQAPGKRAMPAADWARGVRLPAGETFACVGP